jgi:sugar lactone lactonase YvrE
MKTTITESKYKSARGVAGKLFSRIGCLGAAILICASASAQNLFVSGKDGGGGKIFQFTWNGAQTVFASGLFEPSDMAFDGVGNLFFVDYEIVSGQPGTNAAVFKITPNGTLSIFASGLDYQSYLAVNKAGNLFVADYNSGVIYRYKPDGTRTTFASGLYHPVGMACDSAGNLFAADSNAGNIHQGAIYKYAPDGTRVTFAVLNPSDRPADLAFDSTGNLYMADLGGNIYRFDVGILRRYPRTTFGSVPNSAQSLAWDNSGNLYAVDAGDVNGNGNAIYKFTSQAVRTTFASAQTTEERFGYLAFQPLACCQ